MSREKVSFGRPRAPRKDRSLAGMTFVLLVVGVMLFTRDLWSSTEPAGIPVQVMGEVPHPGPYLVHPPLSGVAVELAGGVATPGMTEELQPGDHVWVLSDGVYVGPTDDPLAVGLPVNPNTAPVKALATIPGVGPALAEAIVAEREAEGPFTGQQDLLRVSGVGPSTLAEIGPFVSVPQAPQRDRRLDLNKASERQLQALPGIGPALAARIVEHRDEKGPFQRVNQLDDVSGIGPKTLDRLRPWIKVESE